MVPNIIFGGLFEQKYCISRRNVNPQPKKKDSEFKLIHLIPLVFIGLAYLAMKIPINGTKPAFNWNATEYVYAFGDSYTFIEGTAGHADHRYALCVLPTICTVTILHDVQVS